MNFQRRCAVVIERQSAHDACSYRSAAGSMRLPDFEHLDLHDCYRRSNTALLWYVLELAWLGSVHASDNRLQSVSFAFEQQQRTDCALKAVHYVGKLCAVDGLVRCS